MKHSTNDKQTFLDLAAIALRSGGCPVEYCYMRALDLWVARETFLNNQKKTK